MAISIETEHGLSISTDRPVSITSEGGMTTLHIGPEVEQPRRLAPARPRNPVVAALLPAAPTVDPETRCGAEMKRSGNVCARIAGHNGVHMSAEQLARKQEYNKTRARERYESDPEYRESVKAGSRASHARRKGTEPATE